jgi:2-polyprenyl-3-methyl-5-hydroxy-6-metoxy-1,4-benzoquinol methylase
MLHNFGGVWCDMDMVLLRDLAPLLSQEFMYQWGTETIESKSKERINGAIMRMFKTSKLSSDCLVELTRGNAGLSSTDWGSQMYGRVREYNKNWTVFPCAFFNTEWQLGVNMGESGHPMRALSGAVSDYPGAFAWHWHNKWDDDIEAGSKWERIEKRINDAFERKFNEKEYRFDHRNAHLGGNITGGDSATHEPTVWAALIQKYGIKTMLDVGCTEGQAVRYFENSNVRAIGFDGISQNIERAPSSCFVHDLTRQPLRRVVDLVWCAEVVEHIDERYMDDLLETLSSGRIIAMTFAEKGKSGFHHVNCQHQQYWIDALDIAGYTFNAEVTANMRALAHRYFKSSGLIFERSN